MKLWKTTATIWTSKDPEGLSIEELAYDAVMESHGTCLDKVATEEVTDLTEVPKTVMEFFDE